MNMEIPTVLDPADFLAADEVLKKTGMSRAKLWRRCVPWQEARVPGRVRFADASLFRGGSAGGLGAEGGGGEIGAGAEAEDFRAVRGGGGFEGDDRADGGGATGIDNEGLRD
jgi:hypothetical protein